MRIIFIINSLKNKSGTERVAYHLANILAKKNYEISIINRDVDHENSAYLLDEKIKVLLFKGGYFSFYKKLEKYINTISPDYIFVHNMGRLSLLWSVLNIPRHIKIISLEHVAFESRSKLIQFCSKLSYSRIDQIITLTHQDRLSYQNWVTKVDTIYNISPFNISCKNRFLSEKKRIIAIGRLTYQKNFQALLSAWQLIQADIDDWVLEIYGKGDEYSKLQDFISRNRLRNVELKGEVSNVEIIYQSASMFVMSSRFEGLPMVLIEAQTFGLPIISFNCPHGPSEIIKHNLNGFLVDRGNIRLLAYYIRFLIKNPDLIERFSKQALLDAERFQENEIISLWEKIVFTRH